MRHVLAVMLLGTLAATLSLMASADVRPVASVDLERYLGRWFEIARYPNRFQTACAGNVTAEYAKRPDGNLTVTNRCRRTDGSSIDAVGLGKRVAGTAPDAAMLKVRFAPRWLSFIPQVWGDYWILALAPDYRYAVVGDPSRRYLWVLSRTPQMTESDYDAALTGAQTNGYDTSKLVRTPQSGP